MSDGANNALCRTVPARRETTIVEKVEKYITAKCVVTFEGTLYTEKRGLDIGGDDNRNWKIKSMSSPFAPYTEYYTILTAKKARDFCPAGRKRPTTMTVHQSGVGKRMAVHLPTRQW